VGEYPLPVFLTVAVMIFFGGNALAYEEPSYEIVRKYESFELRQYAPYIVAETVVTGDFEKVGNDAFRILVGYIKGNNRKKEEIPMTAPVNQSPSRTSGETIAMTAPVISSPQGGNQRSYVFQFVMPAKYTLDTLPEPGDSRVRLRQVGKRLMAARTYSGTWSEERYRRNEAALLLAVRDAGLTVVGEPVFARYNSPFTLWFLRRNEVLVEVTRSAQ
jgi:hypothetical protein